jgi:hypothetical protein
MRRYATTKPATHSAVAFHGRETRIAWPASGPSPIAVKTWLTATLPELQAAPALTATPSRSSAITCASARTPGSARHVVLASRSAPPPQTSAPTAVAATSAASRSGARGTAVTATAAAAAKPAIAGRGGVPPRRPRSCPPPAISGTIEAISGASSKAPAPAGPPNLCDESARPCAPSSENRTSIRPAACTASTCSKAPWRRHSEAASTIGCTVPVSLFASIRHTSAGGWSASNAARADRSATPFRSTGRMLAAAVTERTASCSVAQAINRRPMPSAWIASASASVPPDVNTRFAGSAPNRVASDSRASSRIRRAARPAPCTDDGFPVTAMAASMAARASGRSGSVALASR